MSRFAVITLELPLDGGELEDAKALAELIGRMVFDRRSSIIAGRVADVTIEDRRDGAMGRARAESLLRSFSDADDEEDDA